MYFGIQTDLSSGACLAQIVVRPCELRILLVPPLVGRAGHVFFVEAVQVVTEAKGAKCPGVAGVQQELCGVCLLRPFLHWG